MKILKILIIICIFFLYLSCTPSPIPKTSPSSNSSTINAKNLKINPQGLSNLKAIIKTTHGNIIFKFYSKQAPNTVTRIIQLIQKGFYDGLLFHRAHTNFILQTGDPTGTGNGGSGKKLKAEFGPLQHIKGTIAMARNNNDPNSADSQFYIALTTLPHLDNHYTIFGQVVSNLNILNKIQKNDKILSIVLKKSN